MWSATGSEIKDGVEPGAVAQNVRGFHDCGEGLVGQGSVVMAEGSCCAEALQATRRSKTERGSENL